MKPPMVPEQQVPIPTDDELKKLLNTCRGNDFEARRDMAILRMFITTGGRPAEITNLRYDPAEPEANDIDLDMGQARVVGKGGSDRLLPIDPKTVRALNRYLRARAKHPRAHLPNLWLGKAGIFTADGIRQMIERRGTRLDSDISMLISSGTHLRMPGWPMGGTRAI